jgi:hypothetical protein
VISRQPPHLNYAVDGERDVTAEFEITEEMIRAASWVLLNSGMLYNEVFRTEFDDINPVVIRQMLEASLRAKARSRAGSRRNSNATIHAQTHAA